MNISCLDALLLFLVGHKDQSGYEIRQVFQSTPVGLFSDSPGAIYPALARLETRGLLRSSVEQGGRRKRIFSQTVAGREALLSYLREPIQPEAVKRRQEELDLRFVMVSVILGDTAAQAFLRQCADAYADEVRVLEAFRDGPAQLMGPAPMKALELGIRLCTTRREWCFEILNDLDDLNGRTNSHEENSGVNGDAGNRRAGDRSSR